MRPWTVRASEGRLTWSCCFNGATALRPWTDRCQAAWCAPRWRFNGATALRPWTAPRAAATMITLISFNGATALRPWTALRCGLQTRAPGASMGPRPCGRGRARRAENEYLSGELQWGHGLAAVDGAEVARFNRRSASFNGATALRPWTADGASDPAVGPELQWGHGLAAVDGIAPAVYTSAGIGLQWGHGLAAVDGSRRPYP